MSEKQTKKLRRMAKLFYSSQPPNMENKKSPQDIFKELQIIYKNKIHGKK